MKLKISHIILLKGAFYINIRKIIKFIFVVFLPITVGFLVSHFLNIELYSLLNKPPLSPPKIIFPIVWSILYLLMGISFYTIIYEKKSKLVPLLYYFQLFFNMIWPILFFNFKWYLIATIDIVLIISLLINMIIEFNKIKKISGLLNIPYLIWLLFAFYLSLGVYLLN